MSSPLTLTLTRTLAELEDQSARASGLVLRVERSDGSTIEGGFGGVEAANLVIIDSATHTRVLVPAVELRAVAVRAPRRRREWMLALAAIVGGTFGLVGYAMLPWVNPDGDIQTGFKILYVAGAALLSVLVARTGLGRWLTRWQSVYPPSASQGEPV